MNNVTTDKRTDPNPYFWVGFFGIAFGFLEAIVVIYLRKLYYPSGFDFPLIMASPEIFRIEIIRELSTLLMLVTVGILAGKNSNQRFTWFLYAFGVWDIFYYIALKILISWPASLFTWDILFLIPVAWDGPVLAPIICSLTMISFTVAVIELERNDIPLRMKPLEWILILSGALLIFTTFIWDYSAILIRNGFFYGAPLTQDSLIVQEILSFVPSRFHWLLFIFGEMLLFTAIILIWKRRWNANHG